MTCIGLTACVCSYEQEKTGIPLYRQSRFLRLATSSRSPVDIAALFFETAGSPEQYKISP